MDDRSLVSWREPKETDQPGYQKALVLLGGLAPLATTYWIVGRCHIQGAQYLLIRMARRGFNGDFRVFPEHIQLVRLPVTSGYDGAGVVAHVGRSVKDFDVGDRVFINPNTECGYCVLLHPERSWIFRRSWSESFHSRANEAMGVLMERPGVQPFWVQLLPDPDQE